METAVEEARPSKKQAPDKRKRTDDAPTDDMMEQTGLPTSVLDSCEKTFEAADSRRQKASTKFFDDTGTMALLCRHDRVLFLANMKSAGEKQFYVFALIQQLMKNLPPTVLLGILYDIACASERSVKKWGFLPEYQDRIIWALSIFHAYGHEWPCQIVYSPRNRIGFGLSDGEGCERLWSSLEELIPNLRVSGHFRRLYILDEKVEYLHAQSLPRLGLWLARAFAVAENKVIDSQRVLDDIGIDEDTLRAEWAAQLVAQTKPLPSQTKTRAKHSIEKVIRLRAELASKTREVDVLQERHLELLETDHYHPSLEDLELNIADLKSHRERLRGSIIKLTEALGVTDHTQLQKLLRSEFMRLRMNMRAKKQRIRERIRRRKFELSRVERSHRHSVNERKVVDHSEQMITRREPTISRLVTEYNKCCKHMEEMIRRNQVPSGVDPTVPQTIDAKKIFTLEVDDGLWQDTGLEDDTEGVPRWLGDEGVREGIKAMLEVDRGREELDRLKLECANVRTWIRIEWHAIQAALSHFEEIEQLSPVIFALQARRNNLLDIHTGWKNAIDKLPAAEASNAAWGIQNDVVGPAEQARQQRELVDRERRFKKHSPPQLFNDDGHTAEQSRADESGFQSEADEDSDSHEATSQGEVVEDPGLVEALEVLELSEMYATGHEWRESETHEMEILEDVGADDFHAQMDEESRSSVHVSPSAIYRDLRDTHEHNTSADISVKRRRLDFERDEMVSRALECSDDVVRGVALHSMAKDI